MKQFLISQKFMAIIGGVAMAAIVGLSYTNYHISTQESSVKSLSSGLGTCYQRVSQTFTALMIRDFTSNYMAPSFKSATGDCFNEVSKGMAALNLDNTKIKRTLKNLSSDLHWFHSKMDKVVDLAQRDGIDLLQSNIVSKFSDIEDLTSDVESYLTKTSEMNAKSKQLGFMGIVLAQLTLLFAMINFYISRRKFNKELQNVNKMALSLESVSSIEAKRDGIEKIVETTFAKLGMGESSKVISNFISEIYGNVEEQELKDLHTPDTMEVVHVISEDFSSEAVSQKVEKPFEFDFTTEHKVELRDEVEENHEQLESVIRPARVHDEVMSQEEGVSFQKSLNVILDRVQERAFSSGVVLDTNLTENFGVCSSEEALEQLLFYTLSFALDSSLEHDDSRRIILRSKPLGGVAYCKVRIANHAFNDSELSLFNGKEASDQVNVNLILLKELLDDSNASVAVKNKQNQLTGNMESEIEFIFERSLNNFTDDTEKKVNIVKGNKEDIKRFFEQNM